MRPCKIFASKSFKGAEFLHRSFKFSELSRKKGYAEFWHHSFVIVFIVNLAENKAMQNFCIQGFQGCGSSAFFICCRVNSEFSGK